MNVLEEKWGFCCDKEWGFIELWGDFEGEDFETDLGFEIWKKIVTNFGDVKVWAFWNFGFGFGKFVFHVGF